MPNRAVREPGPPSWHAVLLANVHVLVHNIGGGEGEGEGGGEGGGGAGQVETEPSMPVRVVAQEQT